MEAKKQVLSFKDFLVESLKMVMEKEEPGNGGVTKISSPFVGGLKLQGESKASADRLINDHLNAYFKKYPERSAEFVEDLTEAIDTLTNSEKGIGIKNASVGSKSMLGTYSNLIASTVRVKGHPATSGSKYGDDLVGGSLGNFTAGRETETEVLAVDDLLSRIAAWNANALATSISSIKNKKDFKAKDLANFGSESDEKRYDKNAIPFLTISEASLKSDILEIVPYPGRFNGSTTKYGFALPMFSYFNPKKGMGDTVSAEALTTVLPPAGNSTEVADKPYGTSGVSYFEENEVVISEDGKLQTNLIVSEFNSISKIVVNGGASSKPTSRPGGNEKLAKDRQAAGLALLTQMKKDGITQLTSAQITAGSAKVQSASANESDPKFQQVSFLISGMVKGKDVTNDPVVINSIEKTKADTLQFKEYTILIPYEGDLDKMA